MKKSVEVLVAARNLLAPAGAFTQNTLARNAVGTPVFPSGSDAVSWCTIGALHKICTDGRIQEGAWCEAWDLLALFMGGGALDDFADTHTQAEVLAAFDQAIARAGELLAPVAARRK